MDVESLGPLLQAVDLALKPIAGLSAELRDRLALIAAVRLHNRDNPSEVPDELALALGHGLLDAAILAHHTPHPMT